MCFFVCLCASCQVIRVYVSVFDPCSHVRGYKYTHVFYHKNMSAVMIYKQMFNLRIGQTHWHKRIHTQTHTHTKHTYISTYIHTGPHEPTWAVVGDALGGVRKVDLRTGNVFGKFK